MYLSVKVFTKLFPFCFHPPFHPLSLSPAKAFFILLKSFAPTALMYSGDQNNRKVFPDGELLRQKLKSFSKLEHLHSLYELVKNVHALPLRRAEVAFYPTSKARPPRFIIKPKHYIIIISRDNNNGRKLHDESNSF